MDAEDASALADSGLRGGGGHVAILEFRSDLPQGVRESEYILAEPAFGRSEISVVCGIRRGACDIHSHAAPMHHIVEPRPAEIRKRGSFILEFQEFLADWLALAGTVLPAVVHVLLHHFAVGIDP